MNATLLIVSACWVTASGFCSGEDKIGKLPKSVHYSTGEDGIHVVTIDGIADAPLRIKDPQAPLVFSQTPLDYIPLIPDRVSFTVDHDKRTCTLVTSRMLKRSELSAAIDETAKARSDIPCWAELEARDHVKSAVFRDDRYVPKMIDGEVPTGLAWYLLYGSQGISFPFTVNVQYSVGRLIVVPTPVPMGTKSYYKIYVLDSNDRVIWMNSSIIFGPARIAIGDSNGDDQHEIYVESYKGKDRKLFHIKPKSEQAAPRNR